MISQATARALYAALKVRGSCTCQYARAGNGVPLWSGTPLERKRIFHCSSCRAVEAYEQEAAAPAHEHDFRMPLRAQCVHCGAEAPDPGSLEDTQVLGLEP